MKVSVASLGQADFEGFMTKVGGGTKTWHKRWFVLKNNRMYYFKTKKDEDYTGVIELEKDSFVRKEPKKKSKNMFAVGTAARVYLMYPDTPGETDQWIAVLTKAIEKFKNPPDKTLSNSTKQQNNITNITTPPNPSPVIPQPEIFHGDRDDEDGERGKLGRAKDMIPYLAQGEEGTDDGRIYEFWQIWMESIPEKEALGGEEGEITFEVYASADLEKLSWRASGPQHIFIQNMVDFFWNVGAPESEIDRLNDVGSDINPPVIGSWIDMSGKGGMDGGWFFPVETSLELSIKSSDQGPACQQFERWAQSKGIEQVFSVGRDMGAAPPRQTEVRFFVPGGNYDAQLNCALSLFPAMNVPDIPREALNIIKGQCKGGLMISVVTSSEGAVRLGVLFPHPTKQAISSLCSLSGAQTNKFLEFQNALGGNNPTCVEFQYLMRGYGYGVYKEGFDVVFHFTAAVER